MDLTAINYETFIAYQTYAALLLSVIMLLGREHLPAPPGLALAGGRGYSDSQLVPGSAECIRPAGQRSGPMGTGHCRALTCLPT